MSTEPVKPYITSTGSVDTNIFGTGSFDSPLIICFVDGFRSRLVVDHQGGGQYISGPQTGDGWLAALITWG